MHDIDMEDFSSRLEGMDSFCQMVYSTQCSDTTSRASDEGDFDIPSPKRQKTSGSQPVTGIQESIAFDIDKYALDFLLTACEAVNPAYFPNTLDTLSENTLSQDSPFSERLSNFPLTQETCWDESNVMMVDFLPQSDINPQLVENCTPLRDKEISIVPSTEENSSNSDHLSKASETPAKDISMTRFGPGNFHSQEFIDLTCFGATDISIRNNTEFGSVAVGIGKVKRIGSLFTIRSAEDLYLGAIIPEHAQKLRNIFSRVCVDIQTYIFQPPNEHAKLMNVSLNIYGPASEASNVGDLLSREGLFLQEPVSCDDGVRYFNPHTLFVPEEIQLELELEAEDRRNGLSTLETYKSQEDGVFNLFNNEAFIQEDFPFPPISARIKTSLLSHQQEALSFMMRQELSADAPHSSLVLWEEVENRGETRFRHRITGGYSPERPDTRGGIIADEMGMGKTLTTLVFIATSMDEEENSNVERERPVAQVRTTLLIVPAATIVSWKEQIARHTQDLMVLYYSGQSDSDKNAANFDIVIATYAMVMHANKKTKGAGSGKGFFQGVHWRRIVLDEAHVIRNRKAKQTQAICSLKAESRWCLTGTPVQNRLDDFGALLQFLRFAPLDQKQIFSKNVILPLKKGTPDGLKNLKMIIAATTLRRTKKSLEDLSDDLPPRIDTVQRLNMSEEEQRLHSLISDEAKKALDQAIKNGREGNFTGFIMQGLLRIRQLCNGIALLPEDFRLDLFGKATRSDCTNLSSSSAGVCESCQSKLDTATSKLFEGCYHFLCSRCSCKNEASGPTSELCPTCSDRTLNDVDLDIEIQSSTPDPSMLSNSKNVSIEHPSSKIQGLIKNLTLEPGAKSVVFACWVSMLNLISLELDRQGISYTRLDGSMTLERRVQSIKSFREDENKTVMLATIGSSGVGIDLTVATYVHLMEPQYNPMMEEQALARVHRIGQKKQVTTIRYIMKDSYEQSIMELQAQKLRLADMCMGTGTGTRQNLLRLRACLR